MPIRLRNLIAIPALFISFSGEPGEVKAQQSSRNKPEIVIEEQLKDLNKEWDSLDIKTRQGKTTLKLFPQYPNFNTKDISAPQSDFAGSVILSAAVIGSPLLLVLALTSFFKNCRHKISSLEDLIKQSDTNDNFNPRIKLVNDVIMSESLLPEEKVRLSSVLRFVRNQPEFDDLISDPSINLYFDKPKDINKELEERDPDIYRQLQGANYPPWKLREDLKLKSFTLVERNSFLNETEDYIILIQDYKDHESILLSVLRELFRIHTYQNNESKTPVLYSLQIDSLKDELKTLEGMLDVLCQHSPKLEKQIKELIKEERKQLDLWQSASCQYNIDVLDTANLWVRGI